MSVAAPGRSADLTRGNLLLRNATLNLGGWILPMAVALVTVPCMREVDPRLGGMGSARNDPDELRWINQRTAAVARRYGGRAMVVDLGPLVCPGGRALDEVGGVVARADGVHFTPEFAPRAWDFVEERIRPWLATPVTATGG